MDWTNPWVIGPLCTGVGVLVGMFIMRLLGDDGQSAQDAAQKLQQELDEYRDSVGQHFATTSELFQDMTEKYRDVYNHMATGAQEFGGKDSAGPRLEIVGAAERLDGEQATDVSPANDAEKPTAADDATAPGADTVDEAPADETPPVEASADSDNSPEPPIDYDAQPVDDSDTDDSAIIVEPDKQSESAANPGLRTARNPSRWGFKSGPTDT